MSMFCGTGIKPSLSFSRPIPSLRLLAHSSSVTRSLWGISREEKLWSSRGNCSLNLSAASSPLLNNHASFLHAIPLLQTPSRKLLAPKAAKRVHTSFPALTEKPKWWMRTIACLMYLKPAETGIYLYASVEYFKIERSPFWSVLGKLIGWWGMAHFLVAYLVLVTVRRVWPPFFRYHVIMGTLLQLIGTMSFWMVFAVSWGELGVSLWTYVAVSYILMVLECFVCALAGTYCHDE